MKFNHIQSKYLFVFKCLTINMKEQLFINLPIHNHRVILKRNYLSWISSTLLQVIIWTRLLKLGFLQMIAQMTLQHLPFNKYLSKKSCSRATVAKLQYSAVLLVLKTLFSAWLANMKNKFKPLSNVSFPCIT